MCWVHFFPDKAIFFIIVFWAGLKFEVTASLGPVDASRNPSLTFSLAVNKNSLKKLFRILKFLTNQQINYTALNVITLTK
jgi:hypothetical protein